MTIKDAVRAEFALPLVEVRRPYLAKPCAAAGYRFVAPP
jgi:hypothetical protein